MTKNTFFKTFLWIGLAVVLLAGPHFSHAKGSGIFLILKSKNKTRNPDITLRGRVGKDTAVSIFVNGESIGEVSLDEKNRYHVRVPLVIGNNTVRVVASSGGLEKVIQKNIVRKGKTIWISIIHTKNRIKKPDVTVRGRAYNVSEVQISVNGEFQGTALVSAKGKFKFRASLLPGVNIVEARADNGLENTTATKRVRRLL
jgi:hypothetical protein